MKFGFFAMPLHLPTENPVLSLDRDLEMIQWAEDMDYDEFYVGEHHTASWEPIPCPEIFLAKASAFTKTIKLTFFTFSTSHMYCLLWFTSFPKIEVLPKICCRDARRLDIKQ